MSTTLFYSQFQRLFVVLCCVCSLLLVQSAWAARSYPLPTPGNNIIGEPIYDYARAGDVLSDIARRNGVGIDEIQQANLHLSANRRLSANTKVLIPSQFILPPGPREGLVINLAELRLYYYPKDEPVVLTSAVGIGKEGGGWETPIGTTTVTSKQKDPPWRPTANVRAEAARFGTPIPAYFPPGPNNPLGQHTLRLGWPTYVVHGTNRPEGVGGRVSAGCIRMYPEDIERLHALVPIGTKVHVLNEPFKVGWLNGKLYFEAHRPLSEQKERYEEDMSSIVKAIHQTVGEQPVKIKWSLVQQAAQSPVGIPVEIG